MPVYLQPYYRRLGFAPGYCPEAEAYASEAITIPLFFSMTSRLGVRCSLLSGDDDPKRPNADNVCNAWTVTNRRNSEERARAILALCPSAAARTVRFRIAAIVLSPASGAESVRPIYMHCVKPRACELGIVESACSGEAASNTLAASRKLSRSARSLMWIFKRRDRPSMRTSPRARTMVSPGSTWRLALCSAGLALASVLLLVRNGVYAALVPVTDFGRLNQLLLAAAMIANFGGLGMQLLAHKQLPLMHARRETSEPTHW